jgi:hypothetical protein
MRDDNQMIQLGNCELCKFKFIYQEQSFSIHRTISKFLEPIAFIFLVSFSFGKLFDVISCDWNSWIFSVLWYSTLRAFVNYFKNYDRGKSSGIITGDRKRASARGRT